MLRPAPVLRFAFPLPGLLLAACLAPEGEGGRGGPSIIPLAVGNEWVYADTAYYYADTAAAPDSIAAGTSRSGIIGTRRVTLADGRRTVFLSSALDPSTGNPTGLVTWLRDRADGNHTAGVEQDGTTFTSEVLHVKYPATTGERYPTWFPFFRNDGGTLVPVRDTVEIEVADAEHTCAVPAGTFACIQYRGWRPDGALHATGYYAPGIGFLGSETVRTEAIEGRTRTIVRVRRLTSYTLY